MQVLENTKELNRLFDIYTDKVKDEYQCSFDKFVDWLATDGHENLESGECYIEIPSNETKSGSAVILDW